MIHIKDIHKGSILKQIKDIYADIKVGYIGKYHKVRGVEGDNIILDVKIDGDYLKIREKNLGLFEAI